MKKIPNKTLVNIPSIKNPKQSLYRVFLTYSLDLEVKADSKTEALREAYKRFPKQGVDDPFLITYGEAERVEEAFQGYGIDRSKETRCEKSIEALKKLLNFEVLSKVDLASIEDAKTFLETVQAESRGVRNTVSWESGNWSEETDKDGNRVELSSPETEERFWGMGSVFRCWGQWITDDCTEVVSKFGNDCIQTGATDAVEQLIEMTEAAEKLNNAIDAFTGLDKQISEEKPE